MYIYFFFSANRLFFYIHLKTYPYCLYQRTCKKLFNNFFSQHPKTEKNMKLITWFFTLSFWEISTFREKLHKLRKMYFFILTLSILFQIHISREEFRKNVSCIVRFPTFIHKRLLIAFEYAKCVFYEPWKTASYAKSH